MGLINMEKTPIYAAIYTRKSSEEGLEQEFNSLDAQQEACKAYIQSQKHEGWVLVEKEYSDGGISGGTMNRPGLQELLRDIGEGAVNLIVVYKIDRLTRSLSDFSKLVDILDKHHTSFVSITQQFNTSTSMGRLTLNMLLSFAQFEREIAGERVRDKMAAMARKGMWTNGQPPYGYKLEDKKVVPDPEHDAVRIFELYAELRSVPKLRDRLKELNIFTRSGREWRLGALYNMLSNEVYLGKLPYKKEKLDGRHGAIISKSLFRTVQDILAENRNICKTKARAKDCSLLAGLLFNEAGEKYYPSHSTNRNGVRYRYYLSKEVSKLRGSKKWPLSQLPEAGKPRCQTVQGCTCLAAQAVEEAVLGLLPKIAEDERFHGYLLNESFLEWKEMVKGIASSPKLREVILGILDRVIVSINTIKIELRPLPIEAELTFEFPWEIKSRASGKLLICKGMETGKENKGFKELILKSFRLHQGLLKGAYGSLSTLAEAEDEDLSYLYKLLGLRFLAGDILEKILSDDVPPHWTSRQLFKASSQGSWQAQRELLK